MPQENLTRYKVIYQFVYLHVFPEIYTTPEKRGIDLKSNFLIIFKTFRDIKLIQQQQQQFEINVKKRHEEEPCEKRKTKYKKDKCQLLFFNCNKCFLIVN